MARSAMPKLATTMEVITPAQADEYLRRNDRNRKVRKAWVATLATLMRNGDFHTTHQGIAFNCDGSLRDGQHRLTAVVEAGIPVTMMVTRGLPNSAMEAIDGGVTRSVADLMGPMGLDFDVNNVMVATARRMMEGADHDGHARTTVPELKRFLIRHLEPIAFASCNRGSAGLRHASVRAVVSRAWYTRDRARLAQFIEVIGTGVMKAMDDQAAVTLRNAFLREGSKFHGGSGRTVLYRKAEAALLAFLERRPLSRIYEATSELFPIPGDE